MLWLTETEPKLLFLKNYTFLSFLLISWVEWIHLLEGGGQFHLETIPKSEVPKKGDSK